MTQKRLGGTDRKNSILDAATKVFAEHGLQGAKTQQIAAAARVSEALIFRHFESKVRLYRAVLRRLIKEQDTIFRSVGLMERSSLGVIHMMRRYFSHSLLGANAVNANGIRVYYASLAGDGSYARLFFRRSMRLSLKPLAEALEAARQAGDIVGPPIDPVNFCSILEHVGSNLLLSHMREQHIFEYSRDPDVLLEQLLRFHGRGVGFTDKALDVLIPLSARLMAAEAGPEPQSPPAKSRKAAQATGDGTGKKPAAKARGTSTRKTAARKPAA